MRSCSLRGTLPLKTSVSVPRLMPLNTRAHERFVRGRCTQALGPNLAAAGLGDPERARLIGSCRHLVAPWARAFCACAGILANRSAGMQASPYAEPAHRRSRTRGARACAAAGRAVPRPPCCSPPPPPWPARCCSARWHRRRRPRVASRRARARRRRVAAVVRSAVAGRPTFGAANSRDARPRRARAAALRGARRRGHDARSAGCSSHWALAAVALDGVDGALARGRNETSAFGARFDMETDALLILVLAALVWQHGKAGVWILLRRTAALWVRRGELRWPMARCSRCRASRRRQAVCVVQIVSLLGALVPLVVPPWSAVLALAGLVVARLVVRRRRRLARAPRALVRCRDEPSSRRSTCGNGSSWRWRCSS